MNDKILKVGVIGTGMGRFHIQAFATMPAVELTAICDLNIAEARYFAEKFGVKTVVQDYQDLIKMEALDIITIATPNHWHAPMAIDALKAGKHVLCEKPMTVRYEDALEMAQTAQATGLRLMVQQNQRFNKEAHQLKYYQEQGHLGEIYFGRVSWIRRKGTPVLNFDKNGTMGRGEWFISREQAGGGCLYDIGIHLIDLGWYLMGLPRPVAVYGSTFLKVASPKLAEKGLPQEVEDLAAFQIRFENGAALQGTVSWDVHNEPDQFVQIFGTAAGASLYPPKIYRGTEVLETVELNIPTNGLPTTTSYEHFIDCVRNPEKPMLAAAAESATMIRVLNAIQQSAETGHEVVLD